VVNSLWPWGGGRLPQPARPQRMTVWSNDPVIRGIALLQGSMRHDAAFRFGSPPRARPGHSSMPGAPRPPAVTRSPGATRWPDSKPPGWRRPRGLRSGELDALACSPPASAQRRMLVIRARSVEILAQAARLLDELVAP
jgi:hypothetical protein